MGFDDKEMLQKILKTLIDSTDTAMLVVGNYVNEDEDKLEMEYAVSADEDEAFEMLRELFKNNVLRDQARKAILHLDYGDSNIDNKFNVN